ncbi:MAG: methyl-accepting chemotaxis protein [Pseudomonadota bacterium]
MMKNQSIGRRLGLLSIVSFVGMAVIIVMALLTVRREMEAERVARLTNVVETLATQIEALGKSMPAADVKSDQLVGELRKLVANAHYEGTNYFFVYDWDGTDLADGGFPELNGTNSVDKPDPLGFYFRRALVDIAHSKGEGTVSYHYPKPGQTEPLRKTAYVRAIPSLHLMVISAMFVDDLDDAFAGTAWRLGGIGLLVVVLTGFASIALARSIARPVQAMTDAMRRLAARDLTVEIPARGQKDEVGRMADAVEFFREAMIEGDQAAAAQRAEQARKEERVRRLETLTQAFETEAGGLAGLLTKEAVQLQSTAQSMTSTVDQTNQQATNLAAAAEQASDNAQTVASATEELSASIREIGAQVSQSSKIAGQATEDARRTNATVQALTAGAQRIGEVVKLINDIASQTNLLALNATIEAARAGEAGKGFAVVASEVKSLAAQTAKATEDIAGQVEEIRGTTEAAVQAIQGIGATIDEMASIAGSITLAVDQQSAATQEIARNVSQAADGAMRVTHAVGDVRQTANLTGQTATQLLTAADGLSAQAKDFTGAVDRFLAGVRSA